MTDGETRANAGTGLAIVVSHPSQKKGRMGHPVLWLGQEVLRLGWGTQRWLLIQICSIRQEAWVGFQPSEFSRTGMPLRIGSASESATTQATPTSVRFKELSLQLKWVE